MTAGELAFAFHGLLSETSDERTAFGLDRVAGGDIIIYDNDVNESWHLSKQLAERRSELGLSLSQLARRADTSAATLSRYESGWTRFEVYTLHKLATALGCRLVIRLEPKARRSQSVSPSEVVRQLERLFWDQDLSVQQLRLYPSWVIRRVLEYGSLKDVQVLMQWLGRDEFLRLVSELRFETEKTRVFWRQMLGREGVTPCTNESFRREAASFWRSSRV